MSLNATLEYITSHADATDITHIINAVNARNGVLRSMRAAQVRVGARVRIVNISPKYLAGVEGTVAIINGKYADITADKPVFGKRHFNTTRITGIPLSCCEVL